MEIISQAMYKMMVLLRNNNISIKYTGPEEGRSGPNAWVANTFSSTCIVCNFLQCNKQFISLFKIVY